MCATVKSYCLKILIWSYHRSLVTVRFIKGSVSALLRVCFGLLVSGVWVHWESKEWHQSWCNSLAGAFFGPSQMASRPQRRKDGVYCEASRAENADCVVQGLCSRLVNLVHRSNRVHRIKYEFGLTWGTKWVQISKLELADLCATFTQRPWKYFLYWVQVLDFKRRVWQSCASVCEAVVPFQDGHTLV